MDEVKEKAVAIGVRTMLGDLMRVVVDELKAAPGAHALADATKSNVLIVFPGAESMMGGERVAADPQQPPLNLDGNPLAGAIGLDDPAAGDESGDDEGGEDDDD